MIEYKVYLDFNGHSFLKYREMERVWYFVTMVDGTIETVHMTPQEFRRKKLKPYDKSSPEKFAQVYWNSYVPMSTTARAILRPLVGEIEDTGTPVEPHKFSSGSVSLHEICEVNKWDCKKARKYLRRTMNKPGGRWEWEADHVDKIVTILRECFLQETTN